MVLGSAPTHHKHLHIILPRTDSRLVCARLSHSSLATARLPCLLIISDAFGLNIKCYFSSHFYDLIQSAWKQHRKGSLASKVFYIYCNYNYSKCNVIIIANANELKHA